MTKKILLAILFFLFLILGLLIYFYITKGSDMLNNTQKDTNNLDIPNDNTSNDTFKLEKKYVSENSWTYKVTGQLPNPCYSATVDALVAESYPEQVTILLKIIEPNKDMMCAQVIQDFVYEGTFSASELATVTLRVE